MSVSILRHKATDRPEFASLVARGERGLREVDAIVHGLLEFARAGARPGADSNTEIGPVLEDLLITWAPLAEQHHVRIDCEPPPPCNVGCNLGVLTSMLSNLVQNAIKYMGDSPTRRICIRVEDRSNRVRVEVQDTGPGMPSELAPRVFSPYVRGTGTGRPGIGLGLATVKRMAEAHGGCVGVHTALGQGSLFWFELPRATERAPATAVIAGREERSERPALI
jgi:signal transduction histidine kinase